MVWLPEHSLGTAPPPLAAWQESHSPTKPSSGLASAGWGISDHTRLTGPIDLREEPRGRTFKSCYLAFPTAVLPRALSGAWCTCAR